MRRCVACINTQYNIVGSVGLYFVPVNFFFLPTGDAADDEATFTPKTKSPLGRTRYYLIHNADEYN